MNPTDETRNRLVECYLPFVRAVAAKLMRGIPDGVPFGADDLTGYGVFGLVYAINAFEPSRGLKFETYALLRIRGAMLDGIREMDPVGRVNRRRLTALAEMQEREQITREEAARRLGLGAKELQAALHAQALAHPGSLEAVVAHSHSRELKAADVKAIDYRAPEDRESRRQVLRGLLQGFSKTERLLVIGYYHLNQTLKEVAQSLGMSESRASQIHKELIGRLRQRLGAPEQAPVSVSVSSPERIVMPAESRLDQLMNLAPKPEDLELIDREIAELEAKLDKLKGVRKLLEKALKPKVKAQPGALIKRMVAHLQANGPANAEQLAGSLGVEARLIKFAAGKSQKVKVDNDGMIRVAG